MWTPYHFVRYVALPVKVEGVTIPNSDGTFDIYINSTFSEQQQKEILHHELCHIRNDHFYMDKLPVCKLEKDADIISSLNMLVCYMEEEETAEI